MKDGRTYKKGASNKEHGEIYAHGTLFMVKVVREL
jgi:hypothetical protein